jgi:hypothetical protein
MKVSKQQNKAIRTALKKNGLFTYDLGDILGVSEATVIRMMRRELPQDEQDRIISLIEKEGVKDGN